MNSWINYETTGLGRIKASFSDKSSGHYFEWPQTQKFCLCKNKFVIGDPHWSIAEGRTGCFMDIKILPVGKTSRLIFLKPLFFKIVSTLS